MTSPAADKCTHCLLPVNEGDAIIEQAHKGTLTFCCHGCQGVYHIISNTGLSGFYNRRDGWRPGPPQGQALPPEAFEQYVSIAQEGVLQLDMVLQGIRCASCIWLVEHYLQRLPGVVSVRANYATHRCRVQWQPENGTTIKAIIDAVSAVGYVAKPPSAQAHEQEMLLQRRDLLIRFGTGGFFSMQLMLFTVALYAGYFQGIEPVYRMFFQIIAWALATPVMFYSGWPFVGNSLRALKNRTMNMDVLVALGSLSAYVYSVAMVFTGGETYFDTVATIITLILLGRYLELGARGRAGEVVSGLLGLRPREARVIDATGERTVQPVEVIKPGQLVEVIPGHNIPFDGAVVEGISEVDEAMLTGESRPVSKSVDCEVFAGTMNTNGRLVVRVTRVGRDTALEQIVHAVQEAQARRAPIQAVADSVVGWFVPAVLVIALGAFAYWAGHGELNKALMTAVSVLVIACPCALGLATPLAVLVASTRASREGILFKGGDALESTSRVTHVVFDKTGTLTRGVPSLTDVEGHPQTLELAATLEAVSEHSLAKAMLKAHTGALKNVSQFKAHAGMGIEGVIEGQRYLLGHEGFMRAQGVDMDEAFSVRYKALCAEGKTTVALAQAERVIGILALIDEPRADASAVVGQLKLMGIRVSMLTGDNAAVAAYVARAVGIEDYVASVRPIDKARVIADIKARGGVVMMVGDGINDAPALTEAHVGAAVGKATDIALESADMVLMHEGLGAVHEALVVSRKGLSIIKQNLLWAFSYNIIAIPLAVAGMLHPIVSAISMAASSLIVVGNSLRLSSSKKAA